MYEIKRNDTISALEISELRKQVGWNALEEKIPKALDNTYATFSIKKDGFLIAFARVISDGSLYAFIVDLMVHSDWQRKGTGGMLLDQVILSIKNENIRMIQLTFDKKLESFYEKHGFTITLAGSITNSDLK